jgi:hypothetical protein
MGALDQIISSVIADAFSASLFFQLLIGSEPCMIGKCWESLTVDEKPF